MYNYDTIIIGAGAAGLMAAIKASSRGKKTLLLEHTNKIGEKIRISGGGRCNFTNLFTNSNSFISQNPHYVKSALSRYSQFDFIEMVKAYKIPFHEKTLGQLFCDTSSKQIIDMLLDQAILNKVEIKLSCAVLNIFKNDKFKVITNNGPEYLAQNLIIATGGLSIPKIGASSFGYNVARQFGINIIPTKPALVPLIVSEGERSFCNELSGISAFSITSYQNINFKENILFTHKGLSGPAILQISSYLPAELNDYIFINLLPEVKIEEVFLSEKNSKQTPASYLKNFLSKRLVDRLALLNSDFLTPITDLKKTKLKIISSTINAFKILIENTEGYQKAEVTAGGVDTNELSSKTMEAKKIPGLYFIGEVVDVTGWLGGYNFQWAWSSGFAAGSACA